MVEHRRLEVVRGKSTGSTGQSIHGTAQNTVWTLTSMVANLCADIRNLKISERAGSFSTYLTKVAFGSSPVPRTIFTRGQQVGLAECPYLKRWVLDLGRFSIRLHRWESSDDFRAFHDHPWWFVTFVLWGAYTDISPSDDHGGVYLDCLRTGSVRYRPAHHKHTVHIIDPGTWTLVITGRTERRWGFWVNGKLIKRDKYFATMGHHPCEVGDPPVRQRPDGSRI